MEKFDVEKNWITMAGYRAVCSFVLGTHRCGYVGIPKEHPLHGVDYSQSTDKLKLAWEEAKKKPIGKKGVIVVFCNAGKSDEDCETPELVFDVHGGLTYSKGLNDYPIESNEGLWWFGFDCGHAGDGQLGEMAEFTSGGPVRSMEYVVDECESLAKQLKEIS